jgi:hypothetical protein
VIVVSAPMLAGGRTDHTLHDVRAGRTMPIDQLTARVTHLHAGTQDGEGRDDRRRAGNAAGDPSFG